jgi:uncharacterized protein YceK
MPLLRVPRWRRLGAVIVGAALLTGCASVRSLTDYQPGDPVWFAGSRLDIAAISNDRVALAKFHAQPPAWPWLDLPFSIVADLFVWLIPRTPTTPPGAPGNGS